MALLTYDNWYRSLVNRRETNLISPRIFPASDFKLPKNSVIHYLPNHFNDIGPTVDDPIFKGVSRVLSTFYVEKLSHLEGNPRQVSAVYTAEIRKYHSDNKKIRRVFNLEQSLRDPESPLIMNYCYINRRYNYFTNPKKHWYESNNWIETVCSEMNAVFKANNQSHQFIFIELPTTIPALPIFKSINKAENNNQVAKFNTLQKTWLLHIFNILRHEKESIRHAFSNLSNRALNQINIVFVDSGYFTILNLGTFKSWVKSVDNPQGKNPIIMGAYFIRFLLSIMKVRSEDIDELMKNGEEADKKESTIKEELIADTAEEKEEVSDSDDEDEDLPSHQTSIDKKEDIDIEKEKEELQDKSIVFDTNIDDFVYKDTILDESEEQELRLLEAQLQEEIEISEKANERKKEIKTVKASVTDIFHEELTPPEEEVLMQLDDLIDAGLISPKDYLKLQELSQSYKKIEVTNHKGEKVSLASFIDIKPEDIKVEEKVIENVENVPNKDMLKSTLLDFDKKYTKEVLQRDIASMVVNLQRGGICITDYKVEESEDSSGIFNNYEMKITPIKGKSSIVKFRLPKVNEEGEFISNGVSYIQRKMVTDLPIRKISPVRVALTSSYGKVFVERSEKKVFNYANWLTNNIRAASLDKDNSRVTESRTGNVFDHTVKLPYLYTTLAKEFRTFTANNIFFYFDYHKRHKRLGDISTVEHSKNAVACGLKGKDIVYMDYDGNLFTEKEVLPPIEDIIGLDMSRSPVQIAEVSIMGRAIPVGIVLAYKLGFSGLLSLLGVKHQIIKDYRGHKHERHEYAIAFKDVKYVFDKKDRLASLILNGFNQFKHEIMDFDQRFFDQKDVYFNILDTKRVADRFLKEIDLLFAMFVDPITLKILEEMKEPKTFRGLLLRSCQLLLDDQHSDEVSGFEQRIRGYERMASLVYSEMVRNIRIHHNKGNNSNSSITVNPQDISFKFLNDPSNIAVKALNPFQNIRQTESVTYSGIGGRSKETMVRRTRKYHEGDIGVISEATVDSGDVGVNMYTSANPQFVNLYGVTKPTTEKVRNGEVNTVELMSTVFNTMPCIEKDDQLGPYSK